MSSKWGNRLSSLFRGIAQFGDPNPRVILSIPQDCLDAVFELRLLPEDDLTQVFKDALETHNQVVGAIKSGGTLFVHRGAKTIPLDMSHLTTPEVRRASFKIIKGGVDK